MNVESLFCGWSIEHWLVYPITVLLLDLVIRAFLAFLRAFEYKWETYPKRFIRVFRGRQVPPEGEAKLVPDYWHPFVLGFLELLTYPILMKTGNLNVIGAWLTLKTLSHWNAWGTNRAHFNRFLIGNALELIFAYLLAVGFVT